MESSIRLSKVQAHRGGESLRAREQQRREDGGGELFHVVMMEVAPHAEFGGCGLSGRRGGHDDGRTGKERGGVDGIAPAVIRQSAAAASRYVRDHT